MEIGDWEEAGGREQGAEAEERKRNFLFPSELLTPDS